MKVAFFTSLVWSSIDWNTMILAYDSKGRRKVVQAVGSYKGQLYLSRVLGYSVANFRKSFVYVVWLHAKSAHAKYRASGWIWKRGRSTGYHYRKLAKIVLGCNWKHTDWVPKILKQKMFLVKKKEWPCRRLVLHICAISLCYRHPADIMTKTNLVNGRFW